MSWQTRVARQRAQRQYLNEQLRVWRATFLQAEADAYAHDRDLIHTPASLVSATAVVTHCQACGVWLPARPVLFRGGTLCGTNCVARWDQSVDRR